MIITTNFRPFGHLREGIGGHLRVNLHVHNVDFIPEGGLSPQGCQGGIVVVAETWGSDGIGAKCACSVLEVWKLQSWCSISRDEKCVERVIRELPVLLR